MEYFGIFGLASFALVIMYMNLPSKVSTLERKVKRITNEDKGVNSMSKIFEELVGKECLICQGYGVNNITYKVLEVEEEWIKVISTNKKGVEKTEIIRIDDIDRIIMA